MHGGLDEQRAPSTDVHARPASEEGDSDRDGARESPERKLSAREGAWLRARLQEAAEDVERAQLERDDALRRVSVMLRRRRPDAEASDASPEAWADAERPSLRRRSAPSILRARHARGLRHREAEHGSSCDEARGAELERLRGVIERQQEELERARRCEGELLERLDALQREVAASSVSAVAASQEAAQVRERAALHEASASTRGEELLAARAAEAEAVERAVQHGAVLGRLRLQVSRLLDETCDCRATGLLLRCFGRWASLRRRCPPSASGASDGALPPATAHHDRCEAAAAPEPALPQANGSLEMRSSPEDRAASPERAGASQRAALRSQPKGLGEGDRGVAAGVGDRRVVPLCTASLAAAVWRWTRRLSGEGRAWLGDRHPVFL